MKMTETQMVNWKSIPQKYAKDIRKALDLLKYEGCKTVYLFGSMVTGKIHNDSDIDIGIRGLPSDKFFSVYSKLYWNLDNNFSLVDFDSDNSFYSLLIRHNEVVVIE